LRLCGLQAERLRGTAAAEQLLRAALRDKSPDVRLYAVRWISDERIVELRDDVAALLDEPLPNPRYYLAVLAAVDWLDHEPKLRNTGISDALLVAELKNTKRPPQVHSLALQLLSPDHEYLTLDRLREYLASDDQNLRHEAVRTLVMKSDPQRSTLLIDVGLDESQSDDVRADAVAGLSAFADELSVAGALALFRQHPMSILRDEAERALRVSRVGTPREEAKPETSDIAAWTHLLEQPGDAAAGRRIFFSHVGPRCSVCHRHDGRGGTIGPDLTHIGRVNSRERLITSILQPSQEIAPHYQPWLLTTDDGKTHAGLRLAKAGDDGVEPYADTAGRIFTLRSESVESRAASHVSIMPDGLEKTLSIDDLRDLVTFLMTADGK
jgi:putative heme-binding domain-containing protein